MRVARRGAKVLIQTPAKLNLFFEVLCKRSDGYHEIETLMCPIDLDDTLAFSEDSGEYIRLECERVVRQAGRDVPGSREVPGSGGAAADDLPVDSSNLVVRALDMMRERAGLSKGATVRLVKRIPIEAGLGGGSSDAAAALVAGNIGWNLKWPHRLLCDVAAEIGSDVPFFLGGGVAICRGRGELTVPTSGLEPLHFVVVRPPVGLSTATVYQACQTAKTRRSPERLVDALSRGDTETAGRLLFNRLQPAAEELTPWIERLKGEFAREDCSGHGMSGSGTSYFGLCRHARHAQRIARRLRARGVGSVFAVRSCQ